MSQKTIYLDYSATTPTDVTVLDEMSRVALETFGNSASGSHSFGWAAEGVLRAARLSLAENLQVKPTELFFTSGATESNNWVIQKTLKSKQNHIISQETEHKSVLEPLEYLKSKGYQVTLLKPSRDGIIDENELAQALRPDTKLVSLMFVNNETGVIQNIKKLAAITHQNSQALFHTDATQALGKIKLSLKDLDVDFLSASAHKFYGPKGMGFLYIKDNCQNEIDPLILGGGHESGMRSGTVNLPAVFGMALAYKLALSLIDTEVERLGNLSTLFLNSLGSQLNTQIFLNGAPSQKVPHILNLTIPGIPSAILLPNLPRFALSSGSACATGSGASSHVIQSMRYNSEEAEASIRVSLGRYTTEEEVLLLSQELLSQIAKLKESGFGL